MIISHGLSSLAGIADRVVVLYRGRIVEDESSTLRGNLGLPVPGNRYTRARQESARQEEEGGAASPGELSAARS